MPERQLNQTEVDDAISASYRDEDNSIDFAETSDIWSSSPATGGSLCRRCQHFDIQSFAKSAVRRRGYLLRNVEAAAAIGCEFCSLLLDSVKDLEKPSYFYITLFGRHKPTNPDLYVHMKVSGNHAYDETQSTSLPLRVNRLLTEIGDRFSEVKTESKHELCLAADPASPAARNGDVTGRYHGPNVGSDEHYVTIHEWIKECSSHPKCNQTVSGSARIDAYQSPFPARCIEVPGQNGKVYLRETEGKQGAYITLTHRWNQDTESCKTTTDNYGARLEGRGLEAVPRLFQDVFVIAMRLNVRYIWIDSICIIQSGDGGADWRREAPKMAQYYQMSLLTIAGTMDNMKDGLLHSSGEDTTPWASKLVRLPYKDKTNAPAGDFYVYRRKVGLVDDYWDLVRGSILFRRGWILQEWLLSKRILWYTSKGLFFECHSDTPRTDCQERIRLENAKPDLRAHLQLKASFHFTSASILVFWYHALEVYSACHLTKPGQDRILAVAGLAKEAGRILSNPKRAIGMGLEEQNEVYLSGLWLRDIHHGLLWEEDHSSQQWTIRVDEAPTWSWASLLTPVKWPERIEGTERALHITGVCLRRRDTHEHPEHMAAGRRIPGQMLFDPINLSSCLHVSGKLHVVHIRGYLETEENLRLAAVSTAYGTSPASCRWRAVCSPERPELIAGWASVEQLKSNPTTCADFGVAVYALHVSTRHLRTGVLIKRADPVLDVLFLEEADGGKQYRRLGVGRIAEPSLIREFSEVNCQDIQIV